MNTAMIITTDSSSQYDRQRLAVLIIVSVAIHSGILLLVDPGTDILPEPGSAMNQTIQIHLTPNSHASSQDHVRKEVPGKALDAWQLIERSLDHIRSQVIEESDRPPYQTFGNSIPDSHQDALVTTVKAQAPIETYRVFGGGNLRVKMASMFGGFQCFEILPPDSLEAFSSGIWLLVRC